MNLRRPAHPAVIGLLVGLTVAATAFAFSTPAGPSVVPALSAAGDQGLRLKVTAEVANIRQKPSISSLIVRQIPEGAFLDAMSKEGEWYLVALVPDETGTKSGYVHESLVLPLDDPAVPAKKTRVVEQVERPQPKPAETPQPPAKKTTPDRTETPPGQRDAPPAQPRTTAAQPVATESLRPALILSAGAMTAAVGDLNDGSQGLADYYGFQLGASADLKLSPLNLVFPFEAEVRIPIGGRLALSLAGGYAGVSSQSTITYNTTGSTDSFTSTPGFSAIQFKAGLLFEPVPYFAVKAGLLVVRAKASYDYRFSHDMFWQEWTGEASAFGLGGFAALGIALPLSTGIDFVLEAGGHMARIDGFDGTGTYMDSDLDDATEEAGKLFAFDAKPTPFNSYPLLFIRSKKPTEGGVANAREAVLDLLGVSLKAGLKFKF